MISEDGERTKKIIHLDYQTCDQENWDSFYETTEKNRVQIEHLKQ